MEEATTSSCQMDSFSSVSRSALKRVKKMENDVNSFPAPNAFRFAELIDKIDHLLGLFPHIGRETCYKTLKNCDQNVLLAIARLNNIKAEQVRGRVEVVISDDETEDDVNEQSVNVPSQPSKLFKITAKQSCETEVIISDDETEECMKKQSVNISTNGTCTNKRLKNSHERKSCKTNSHTSRVEDASSDVTEIKFQLDKCGNIVVNGFGSSGLSSAPSQDILSSLPPNAVKISKDSSTMIGLKSAGPQKSGKTPVASPTVKDVKTPNGPEKANAKRRANFVSKYQESAASDSQWQVKSKRMFKALVPGNTADHDSQKRTAVERNSQKGKSRSASSCALPKNPQAKRIGSPKKKKVAFQPQDHRMTTTECLNTSSESSVHKSNPNGLKNGVEQVTSAGAKKSKPLSLSSLNSCIKESCPTQKDVMTPSAGTVASNKVGRSQLNQRSVTAKKRTSSASENMPRGEKVKRRRESSQSIDSGIEEGIFIIHGQPREIEECFPLAITYNVEPKKASLSDIVAYMERHYLPTSPESLESALKQGVVERLWKKSKSSYILMLPSFNPARDDCLTGQIANAILASTSPKQCLLKKVKTYIEDYHPEFFVKPSDMKQAVGRAVRYNLIRKSKGGSGAKRSANVCTLLSNFIPSPAILQGRDTVQDYHLAENYILYHPDHGRKQSGERVHRGRNDFSFILHSQPRGIDDTFPLAITFSLDENSSTDIERIKAFFWKHYPDVNINHIHDKIAQGEMYKLWTSKNGTITLLTKTANPYLDKAITGKILNAIVATSEPKRSTFSQLVQYVKDFHPKLMNASNAAEDMQKAIQWAMDQSLIRLVPSAEIQGYVPHYELTSPFIPSPEILKGHDTENHYKVYPKILYSHWK